MERDIYGEALYDFHTLQKLEEPLLLHSSYGEPEEMPVEIFFRDPDDFPDMEHIALALCDGKVLDVGAGVGGHSLLLQEKGFDLDAIELNPIACSIMKKRGVRNVIQEDFFQLKGRKYDTLLFLMNGIGLVGSLDELADTLDHCKALLTENGQLIFDSSDVNYLYTDLGFNRPTDRYYGEVGYQYEYKGSLGEPFKWLYIAQQDLIKIAHEKNWVVQVLHEDEYDQYLVRMEPRK